MLLSTRPGNCVEQYSFNFFSRGKLGAIVIQLELFQSKLVVCIWSLNFYYSFSKFKSMRVYIYIYIEREREEKQINHFRGNYFGTIVIWNSTSNFEIHFKASNS